MHGTELVLKEKAQTYAVNGSTRTSRQQKRASLGCVLLFNIFSATSGSGPIELCCIIHVGTHFSGLEA